MRRLLAEFIKLGGAAVMCLTSSEFFPQDTRQKCRRFVKAFKAKYN